MVLVKSIDAGTRRIVYLRLDQVVAIQEINQTGSPTRMTFAGGATFDVCGTAAYWRYELEQHIRHATTRSKGIRRTA